MRIVTRKRVYRIGVSSLTSTDIDRFHSRQFIRLLHLTVPPFDCMAVLVVACAASTRTAFAIVQLVSLRNCPPRWGSGFPPASCRPQTKGTLRYQCNINGTATQLIVIQPRSSYICYSIQYRPCLRQLVNFVSLIFCPRALWRTRQTRITKRQLQSLELGLTVTTSSPTESAPSLYKDKASYYVRMSSATQGQRNFVLPATL